MSHAETTHPLVARGSATPGPVTALFARLARGWRFAVEVVRDARAMEAKYRREQRMPFRGW